MNPLEVNQQVENRLENSPKFPFTRIQEQFISNDPKLRLHTLSEIIPDTEITQDISTWSSSTVRGGKIRIGSAKNPKEIEDVFKWGTSNEKEEMIVKVSHEVSHKFQEVSGLEQTLVAFLSGSNTIDQKLIPYIKLYASLVGKGSVTGLASLSVYHLQTEEERARVTSGIPLDVRVLEDITELLAAYSLGDDYFNFRLDNANRILGQVEKEEIAGFIIQIFAIHNS